ncbi:PAS domain S-box-containing protein [Cyclobacterium xiamenense]|uniref:histidine kinase n=1 Tax=Cyclobacterium xiamenense TaxID=1297121 RepID=A0A1H6ZTC1_9BACT|nr:PAS domain S-box protein [Cyclobacterium xiamenense]SEJ55444.1 PAS domain S-box-containing protein [Cyclobacterium xiamenense]
MEKDKLNIQVLLEIALNQRIQGEIEDSLERVLTLYLRKLNCFAAAIFQKDALVQVLPKAMLKRENWLVQAKQLLAGVDSHSQQPHYQLLDQIHWYAFPLDRYGYMVLMRQRALGPEMQWELGRVAYQLGRDLCQAKEEQRLRLLQELFDNSSDAIQIAEESGKLYYINMRAAERLGIEKQQAQRYRVGDFEMIFENEQNWKRHVQDLEASGQMIIEGTNIHQKTGETTPVEVTATITRIKDKKFIVAISRDISERKKQERALNASNQKLTSIFNEMSDVVWSVKLPENQVIFISPSVENLYEIAPAEWLADIGCWEKYIYPEDRAVVTKIRKALEAKGSYSVRYRILTPSGKTKWIRNNGKLIFDNERKAIRLDGVMMDRTQQYQAQETLQQELKLQEVLIDIATTYINLDLSNLSTTVQQSLEKMGHFVAADRAYIFDYDFKEGTTSNTYEWCAEGINPEINNLQQVPISLLPNWVKAHRRNEAFYVPRVQDLDDEKDGGLKSLLEPQNIKSLIAIPMMDRERLVGFVGFDSVKKHHQYSQKEQKLLYLFGQMLINVRNRKKWGVQLQVQEEKFRNLIANMNLGLLEVDLSDQVIYANQSFCQMSGYTLNELKGQLATNLLYPAGQQNRVNQKNQEGEQGITTSFEVEIKNKKGEPKWWFVSWAPNYNDQEQLIGSIAVHLDITEQKQLEQELAKAKSFAEAAAKAKELFLANMSHEIRTPLNVIIGMIRQLRAENLGPKQHGYVLQAQTSAKHLLTILNNILDVAKIESGDLEIIQSEFSPAAMAQNVYSILYSQAKDKCLDFSLQVSPQIRPVLVGDEVRLRQVLINLLGNAIKFTEKGNIQLRVHVLQETDSSQTLQFETADTGIGMSEEFIQKIFDKFSQEQNTSNRRFEGTGLGMAISHDLVRLMGSELQVESRKNEGTKFSFVLTLPIGDPSKLVSQSKETKPGTFLGRKALLVEDNEMNRFIAMQSLDFMGFQTTEAENGKKAIEHIKNKTFDLILMDIQMPVMDGVEATAYIRRQLNVTTPILALTANAFRHDIDLYLHTGMNDFITKPYDEQDFFRKIEQVLRKPTTPETESEPDQTDSGNDDAPAKTSTQPLFDLSQLEEISRGSEQFIQKMCELFVSLADEITGEMQQALDQRDWPRIQKAAHKIKPSLDQFGVDSIKNTVRDVEDYVMRRDNEEEFKDMVRQIIDTLHQVAAGLPKASAANGNELG